MKNRYKRGLEAALNAEAGEIMEEDVIVAENTATWPDALELMVEKDVGDCPVVDEQRRVVGIITERDMLKFLAAHTGLRGCVNFYMSKNVLTARFNDSVGETMENMISRGLRRIPIMKGGVFTGLITIREILRYFAEESFKLLITGKVEEALKEPVCRS